MSGENLQAMGSSWVARDLISKAISQFGVLSFLLILIVITGVLAPSFLAPSNISNLLLQLAPLGIVVLGQTFVIIARGLDLSVASVMATAAVSIAAFPTTNAYAPIVVVTALLIGASTGLVNGLLIIRRQVSPFLATLATTIVLEGLRLFWTQGAASGTIPSAFRVVGSMNYHGIPYNLMLLGVLALVLGVLLHKSVYGRSLFIVGGNPDTAHLVGLRANTITLVAYVICGCTAAIAGLVVAGNVGMIDNYVGRGFELDSIVAAVIGGIVLTGGRGNLFNALLGAAILTVLSNAVLLIGVPIQFQIIMKGIVVILAAAFYISRAR